MGTSLAVFVDAGSFSATGAVPIDRTAVDRDFFRVGFQLGELVAKLGVLRIKTVGLGIERVIVPLELRDEPLRLLETLKRTAPQLRFFSAWAWA